MDFINKIIEEAAKNILSKFTIPSKFNDAIIKSKPNK